MKTFGGKFFAWIGIALLFMAVICFLPWLLTKPGPLDFRETGQIGDTLGGIMGPFVAMVGVFLTFAAFWVQYVANIQQQQDIALDSFENRLFQMLSLQADITANLEYFSSPDQKALPNAPKGRGIFRYIYEERIHEWHCGLKGTMQHAGLEGLRKDSSMQCLDHYMRHLYRIMKFIDEARVLKTHEDKYGYCSTLRATLSEYELLVVFYSCLANDNEEKFKSLIENYTFFNNIHPDNLEPISQKMLTLGSQMCIISGLAVRPSLAG